MKAAKQKQGASPRLLTNGPHGEPAHDEIALCVYSLWEQQGRPQDREVGNWLQAEAQLRQSQSQHGVQALAAFASPAIGATSAARAMPLF